MGQAIANVTGVGISLCATDPGTDASRNKVLSGLLAKPESDEFEEERVAFDGNPRDACDG